MFFVLKVPDGALLTLVPKQSSMYNLSIMTDKVDRHKYGKLKFDQFNKVMDILHCVLCM